MKRRWKDCKRSRRRKKWRRRRRSRRRRMRKRRRKERLLTPVFWHEEFHGQRA